MGEFEDQLDAQRSETRTLGEEFREAVADLARRQDAVERLLHRRGLGRGLRRLWAPMRRLDSAQA